MRPTGPLQEIRIMRSKEAYERSRAGEPIRIEAALPYWQKFGRQIPDGCEAGQSTHRTIDKVLAGDQHENHQSARHQDAQLNSDAGGQGD